MVNQVMGGSEAQTSSRPAAKKELGKDDFLKLFITRLRYQNPLEPVNDEQFIAQMAQFSSLEQMQNMNSSLSELLASQQEGQAALFELLVAQGQINQLSTINQAVAFLGKEVTVKAGERSVVGVVEKIVTEQGYPRLVIAGQRYSLAQVVEVRDQVTDQVTGQVNKA